MSASRRSPAHDELEVLECRWGSVARMPVALDFGQPARELGICDVSAFPRLTIKGSKAASLLGKRGIATPENTYDVCIPGPGAICIRTGSDEFFVEDGPAGSIVSGLEEEFKAGAPKGAVRVLRQDISILLTGAKAPLVMAETCGYDFARPERRVVFSRVAGVSCSILQRDFGGVPVHQLWADGTYGPYLWHALHEIVDDLGGAAVGLQALLPVEG